jgi:flagellar FliJ protein
MAFQFPLATVLRVRGIVEEREERLLQQIMIEISQAQEVLARTNVQIVESDALRLADILKPSIGHQLHASYGVVHQLKQSRKDLEEQLQKLEQLRGKQLMVYEAARRGREMLTDMRQEQRGEYDSDMARREQKTLDDNHIARRGRR